VRQIPNAIRPTLSEVEAMKSMRRFVEAASLTALLLVALPSSGAVISSAEAAQGVRAVATVCAWDELDWSDLSSAEKGLWRMLGWSEMRWESDDENAFPASWSKDWDELDLNERSAAWNLGYTPNSWDSDDPCP
jgi:hypothetical protein